MATVKKGTDKKAKKTAKEVKNALLNSERVRSAEGVQRKQQATLRGK